jgi:NAD+ synthase
LLQDIINAPPTDGLWADGRNDEDQLGMTYPELEQAMLQDTYEEIGRYATAAETKLVKRYREIRARNLHKMTPIPVCTIPH